MEATTVLGQETGTGGGFAVVFTVFLLLSNQMAGQVKIFKSPLKITSVKHLNSAY